MKRWVSMVVGAAIAASAAATATPASAAELLEAASKPTASGPGAHLATRYDSGAALVVSPRGSDSAAGTASAPLRTLGAAIAKARPGSTIALREGTYSESVEIPAGKSLTIQNYDGEAVWLDGSRTPDNWSAAGSAWTTTLTREFDASPTYTRGAKDSDVENWRFVDPKFPMAAHPEQVWVDDVAQTQVGARDQVKPGTFYVEGRTLYLGSDPAGHRVAVSDQVRALITRADNTTVRGIGIRRYSPSVPDMGAVVAYAEKFALENVAVTDSANAGIGVYGPLSQLKNVTVADAGQMGIQSWQADGMTIDQVRVTGSNREHFNAAPAAGGIKLDQSRALTVRDSVIENTIGNGFWIDESCSDLSLVNNTIRNTTASGIMLELSTRATVANNVVTGAKGDALHVRNSSKIGIWNNTLVSSQRALEIAQDDRVATKPGVAGHDPRNPGDPDMTWLFSDIESYNNIFQGGPDAAMIVGVENWTHEYDASSQRITSSSNAFVKPRGVGPRWVGAWARKGTDPFVSDTLANFFRVTGQERSSFSTTTPLVGDRLAPADGRLAESGAPLSTYVAGLIGHQAGSRHVGAFR